MNLTEHAQTRCAQRQIDPQALSFIKKHGQKIHRTGITFYFLGKRNIPPKLRRDDRYAKLEGTTLLISADGAIITTYRNPEALKTIRKKMKYRMHDASYKQALADAYGIETGAMILHHANKSAWVPVRSKTMTSPSSL